MLASYVVYDLLIPNMNQGMKLHYVNVEYLNALLETVSKVCESNGSYVVNDNVKVRDFLDYWLEYDIRKRAQSSNTYDSYSSIVRHHINPAIGDKKLTEVNKGDVQRLYKDRAG